MTVYVAMRIGCIECGEPSEVIGVFAKKNAAVEAAKAFLRAHGAKEEDVADDGHGYFFTNGQNRVDVFEAEVQP